MASRKSGLAELAARYAAALYELASESTAVDQTAGDLENLRRLLDASPELARVIRSPVIARADQARAVEAVLTHTGASDLVRRFVRVIATKRRLFALPAMITAFRVELARRRGEVTAAVAVARPLSDEQTHALTDALKSAYGARVTIDLRVTPALLGGMTVKVGSHMIDNSLKTKVDKLQIALKAPGGSL